MTKMTDLEPILAVIREEIVTIEKDVLFFDGKDKELFAFHKGMKHSLELLFHHLQSIDTQEAIPIQWVENYAEDNPFSEDHINEMLSKYYKEQEEE